MPDADRELLALAAKAAGYPIHSDAWACVHGGAKPQLYMGNRGPVWNPLDDDCDALRLAHAVRIMIDFSTQTVSHYRLQNAHGVFGNFDMKLVRRLIVQVAAEVAALPPEPKGKPISMKDIADLASRLQEVRMQFMRSTP